MWSNHKKLGCAQIFITIYSHSDQQIWALKEMALPPNLTSNSMPTSLTRSEFRRYQRPLYSMLWSAFTRVGYMDDAAKLADEWEQERRRARSSKDVKTKREADWQLLALVEIHNIGIYIFCKYDMRVELSFFFVIILSISLAAVLKLQWYLAEWSYIVEDGGTFLKIQPTANLTRIKLCKKMWLPWAVAWETCTLNNKSCVSNLLKM